MALAVCLGVGAQPENGEPNSLPDGFVYVDRMVPGIVADLKYASRDNVTGEILDGYRSPRAILTLKAARALVDVQKELKHKGFGLKLMDAYRPVRAVRHLMRWVREPGEGAMKPTHYPALEKKDLAFRGYLALHSAHSRGSSVDVTLVTFENGVPGKELDMGTPFDYFGREAWTRYSGAPPGQKKNRMLLLRTMQRHGFKNYWREWWHFTLENEPFPKREFDFPVE